MEFKIKGDSGSPESIRSLKVMTEVLQERIRQKKVEGWSEKHDDNHVLYELGDAAACYTLWTDDMEGDLVNSIVEKFWPWHKDWWKPTSRRRNLVKAAALIVAEIERIDRLT